MKDMTIYFSVYILHALHVLHGKIKYSELKVMIVGVWCHSNNQPYSNPGPTHFQPSSSNERPVDLKSTSV